MKKFITICTSAIIVSGLCYAEFSIDSVNSIEDTEIFSANNEFDSSINNVNSDIKETPYSTNENQKITNINADDQVNLVNNSGVKNTIGGLRETNKREENTLRISKRGNSPREHIIDQYRVNRILKRKEYRSHCSIKESSFGIYEDCLNKAMKKYKTDYPDRGTDEYGEKFYLKLTKEEGKIQRDKLIELLDWASYYPKSENENKEISIDHIRREIFYIERYVMKINPSKYETR